MKVKHEDIQYLINTAETEEHIFHSGKSMVVSYKLVNGFTVDGRSAMLDHRFFDIEIGRELCRRDAERQLWMLEAYLLNYHNNIQPYYNELESALLELRDKLLNLMCERKPRGLFTWLQEIIKGNLPQYTIQSEPKHFG
ncbi:hypothetical protein BLD44_028375 [Mastigocladus laminosus UU774]|nr:hypothetical protein BLD44_028375 [Mastigocladus laminosus UU774]